MNLKLKTTKRAPGAPAPRPLARPTVPRPVRPPDLGDRRLQLLLAAVR